MPPTTLGARGHADRGGRRRRRSGRDDRAVRPVRDRPGADCEGIYLAAYAGAPVTLAEMTDADITAMFRPKLDAALLLHTLSLRTPLRHFVLFSSISGLLGSRWLAHYTATSTFLDSLAHARRNLGLPATVVNWGLWKSLDDTASEARQVMSETGLIAMPDEVAITALATAISPDAPVECAVVDADWTRLAAAYRTRGALRILDDLLTEHPDTTTHRQRVPPCAAQQCPPEQRRQLLVDHVATLASAVMGLTPAELDPSTGFFQLGMDSLMSVTLQRNLSASLGQPLSPAVIFNYPTVDSLAAHLATLLPELAEPPTVPTNPAPTPTPGPPETNCCNNSAKGWADQHEHPHTRTQPHHHRRSAAQDRRPHRAAAGRRTSQHRTDRGGGDGVPVSGRGEQPRAVLGSAHRGPQRHRRGARRSAGMPRRSTPMITPCRARSVTARAGS